MILERMKTVLISVYDKNGIADFAKALAEMGWAILASGGTCRHLREAGIDAHDVADMLLRSFVIQAQRGGITFSEKSEDIPLMMARMREHGMDASAMLGHRVVTLSREVAAALLARYLEADLEELAKRGIPLIDMVVCDFYPLSEEVAKPDATIESVIEKTDIGGPTMMRAAAKGGRIVVCDQADRKLVITMLQTEGEVNEIVREYLRAKAEFTVASYCLDSARFHGQGEHDGILGRKAYYLAYGENRDQSPATLFFSSSSADDPLAWDKFDVLAGEPSYISMADGDRGLGVMSAMAESFRRNFSQLPFIALICKHGNPCGAAIDWKDPAEALIKALSGDPIAAMGGELMTNFPITQELGQLLYAVPEELQMSEKVGRKFWGMDVVYAPAVDSEIVTLLGKKEKRRVLVNPALANPTLPPEEWMYRLMRGGFLKQKMPTYVFDFQKIHEFVGVLGAHELSGMLTDMIIAWAIAWHSVSNTVALANKEMLIGLGCGQQDRIACVQLALNRACRAKHQITGSVCASDGFWPYACRANDAGPLEGPELLVEVGCSACVVPADGKNLPAVKAYFEKHGIKVAFLAPEHRGFFGH